MKTTIKNSALLATALISLGVSSSSVLAATASTAKSTGVIKYIPNTDPTLPEDPDHPDTPGDPDHPGMDPDNPDTPIDPDDPGENGDGNHGTGNKGPLSLDYVSNIDFGTAKTNGQRNSFFAKNDDPFVQVTDSREAGSWKLTAALTTPFTNSVNGSILKGAIMHWENGEPVSSTNNSSLAPVIADKDVKLTDSKAVNFLSDNEAKGTSAGKGTWLDRFQKSGAQAGTTGEDLGDNNKVQLEVPGGIAQAGTYTGEITWTLADSITE